MNEEYDYIVLGTGLKECVLSGLLSSVAKKKILHMDRNGYYGGESASLNLEQLYKRFKPEEKVPEALGRTRDYNVDLCPKFIMSCGNLVKMLLSTQVTRYLDFRSVMGSFVMKDNEIHKVPATPAEALNSGLMGFFQKRRFRNYLEYVQAYDEDDQKTWEGLDLNKVSNKALFDEKSCDENTVAFTGHAMALYQDDEYLKQPAAECIRRVKLYVYSLSRYGNSPYIYPVWGLGGLPEGFSRLCAIHGGVYMLNKPVEQILYNDDGTVKGVKCKDEEHPAFCKKLVADPSYFLGTNKVKKGRQIARKICIMSHPIPGTNDADSCQLILPGKHTGRKSDIYIAMVSHHHNIAAKGKYIATISLYVETDNPQQEMRAAEALLGKCDETFFWVSDFYTPTDDGSKDNVFITSSYDASSHFETATREIMRVYERLTGQPVDLSAKPETLGDDPQ